MKNKKVLIIPALVLGATVATFGFSTKVSAMSFAGFFGFGRGNEHASVNASINDNENGQGESQDSNTNIGDHGVVGTVTAINGSTITLQSKSFARENESDSEHGSTQTPATTTGTVTFTVNAGSAPVTKNGAPSSVSAIVVGDTLMVRGTLSGTTITATKINDGRAPGDNENGHDILDTVTAVSGNTITIQSKAHKGEGASSTATTYTVDATNAAVVKAGVTSPLSIIAAGDMVVVQGTVNGSTITATRITDGVRMKKGEQSTPGNTQSGIGLLGNGQPIIGGKVTAINGNTVTITNSSNVTYTIDVTHATISKNGSTTTASGITVGDQVLAQGTINGSTVTATTVIDGTANANSGENNGGDNNGNHLGIFKQIGSFFSHLFGF